MKESVPEDFRLVDFGSCHAGWDGRELTIGNDLIERKWVMIDGEPRAISIKDTANGIEWLAGASQCPAPCPPWRFGNDEPAVSLRSWHGRESPVEEESLQIELSAARAGGTLTYRFQIFPGAAAIRTQLVTDAETPPDQTASDAGKEEPTGIEEAREPTDQVEVRDCIENFIIGPLHFRLTAVELRDQTDKRNELTFETEWLPQPNEWDITLEGNLFVLEESLSGRGLLFLKHAPLPHVRPLRSGADLSYSGRSRQLTLSGNGIGAGAGYPSAIVTYAGGRFGRIAALQNYQRQLRSFAPGRDGLFLSNTWGDRSRDARINEAFMGKEIEAGARLGVEVIQIDDGWQRGVTANSAIAATAGGVWNGFWAADAGFWEPHPQRFPHGLGGIIAQARERGMRFGLWFAPDSSNDFRNWERDAGKLLELHRDLGVCYFKVDGVKVHSRLAERNLHRLFDKVLAGSDGHAVIDLDVTAESRPGYFGVMNCGPLFVENRYTDWHNHWPHQTLRNLWKLAHYVDPLRLRMEFLNHARNADQYANDPLAPGRYRPDYLFATVMFSNPLGWFETSNLPAGYFEQAAPLVKKWKEHRDAIFNGRIYPIGEPPDGGAWTGFLSVGEGAAYILVFRELNPRESHDFDLPAPPMREAELLGGEGSSQWRDGKARVSIPNARRFYFARLTEETR